MAELEMAAIRHPKIDGGKRVVEVPKSALPHHLRAGWELAEPPAPPPPTPAEQPTEAPASAGASVVPGTDQPPRRRRASSKEED